MLGAGHQSLAAAGGGSVSYNLTYYTNYGPISYIQNNNSPVPILGNVGDLIIVFVDTNATSGVVNGMTGWTSIYFATGNNGGNSTYTRAYYKVKTFSDTTFSDTTAGFWQIIYTPNGVINSVTISSQTQAYYTTSPTSTHTLTMPASGIYFGIARFTRPGSAVWSTKTYSITPSRVLGTTNNTVWTWENLTGQIPISNTTISGTFTGNPVFLSSFVVKVNVI